MKTNTLLKIVTLCVICAATLMAGCLESGYEHSNTQAYTDDASSSHRPHDVSTSDRSSLSTQHVSGIDTTTTLNNVGTLHVSGIDNTVTVSNSNIKRVYLSGIDNIVYIPASSDPYISQSGIGCSMKRY